MILVCTGYALLCLRMKPVVLIDEMTAENRTLLEFRNAGQVAISDTENRCNVSELSFGTMFENVEGCKYFEVSYVNLCATAEKHSNLFLLHVNISSLNKNFDEPNNLLTSFPCHPDIVCVSETRLKGENL